jgi:hypothetical protein
MIISEFEHMVKQAFADVSPVLGPIDPADGEAEPSIYEGKQWWELSAVALNPEDSFLLSVYAQRYYLPAYLVATVRNDWLVFEKLLDVLYPPDSPWDGLPPGWWERRFEKWDRLMQLLTTEQKHVVKVWLELVRQQYSGRWDTAGTPWKDSIDLMLNNYWGAF